MRAYFDTEFIEIYSTPLTLVSIGIVRDDGQELYMVSSEFRRKNAGSWFKKHVWPHIEFDDKFTFNQIALAVQGFMRPVNEIVTRQGENDFKFLGAMLGWLPLQVDLEKMWHLLGRPELSKRPTRHHALDDAHHHRNLYFELSAK